MSCGPHLKAVSAAGRRTACRCRRNFPFPARRFGLPRKVFSAGAGGGDRDSSSAAPAGDAASPQRRRLLVPRKRPKPNGRPDLTNSGWKLLFGISPCCRSLQRPRASAARIMTLGSEVDGSDALPSAQEGGPAPAPPHYIGFVLGEVPDWTSRRRVRRRLCMASGAVRLDRCAASVLLSARSAFALRLLQTTPSPTNAPPHTSGAIW